MTWKDVHSKLSEEKHIAKRGNLATFCKKKKKIPTGIDIKKHLDFGLQGVNGSCS